MAAKGDLGGSVCAICFDSRDFRVLPCHHLLCFGCLESIHTDKGRIICPFDNNEYTVEPHTLPTREEYEGELIYNSTEEIADFILLLKSLLAQRKVTTRHLRAVAEILKTLEQKCAISKITGSAFGVSSLGSISILFFHSCKINFFSDRQILTNFRIFV